MYGFTSRNGQLTADGSALNSFCCRIMNLAVLLDYGDLRGDDTLVSGTPGKVANQRRFDTLTRTLNLIICGDVDQAGEAYDDGNDGLISNIFWIRTNITDPTGSGGGTRALVLTWGGNTLTATGRIGPLTLGDTRAVDELNATCEVELPFGPFA